MRVRKAKTFNREDFKTENADFAEKIGEYINNFTLDVGKAFEKQISWDNLNQDYAKIQISTKSDGSIEQEQLKRNSGKKIVGIQVIHVRTIQGSDITSTPFIVWEYNERYPELININKIFGLSASSKYEISIIVYGE